MSYTLRQNPADPSNYTKGRSQKLSKIVIHHAATTSFDGIGRTFKNPKRNASAHYGVGRDQNVDQYVAEANTAWHAGTKDPATNPNPSSIGIENVNMTMGPDWAIDEATFDTLCELVADIAKRNGLLPLVVGKNLSMGQDLSGHKDYANTFCPGHLYPRLQELADRVNDGTPVPPNPSGPDQVLHDGEKFKFTQTYRVDELKKINGIWQVKTNALCPKGFTWNDNGIPVDPLVEVAPNTDQRLSTGSMYTIPGTYTVLDIGKYQDRWLAKIKMGGWYLWVDVETVTEV